MPSSLTVSLSSALVFSTRPPVSVCGTGRLSIGQPARFFSGVCSSAVVTRRRRLVYSRASPPPFPPADYGYTLQRAIPSARTRFAPPSPLGLRTAGLRNIDRMSIHSTRRVCVRSRLNLNRLALFRNPWSSGEGVSHPLCRYLYLHLLFHCLHSVSRRCFSGGGMLPYRSYFCKIPRLRHRTYARLLSMRGRSTSELLRTL